MNHNGEKIINAENMNVDATLEKLSNELKPGENTDFGCGKQLL